MPYLRTSSLPAVDVNIVTSRNNHWNAAKYILAKLIPAKLAYKAFIHSSFQY